MIKGSGSFSRYCEEVALKFQVFVQICRESLSTHLGLVWLFFDIQQCGCHYCKNLKLRNIENVRTFSKAARRMSQ